LLLGLLLALLAGLDLQVTMYSEVHILDETRTRYLDICSTSYVLVVSSLQGPQLGKEQTGPAK